MYNLIHRPLHSHTNYTSRLLFFRPRAFPHPRLSYSSFTNTGNASGVHGAIITHLYVDEMKTKENEGSSTNGQVLMTG